MKYIHSKTPSSTRTKKVTVSKDSFDDWTNVKKYISILIARHLMHHKSKLKNDIEYFFSKDQFQALDIFLSANSELANS